MPPSRLHLLTLLALLAGCGDSAASEGEPVFGGVRPDECIDGTEGVRHGHCDGLQFDLHVPPECLERACGLILDIHGATMTGEQQEANTSLGSLARGRGYLVLQPWAPEMAWEVADYALDDAVLALTARVMEVFSVDTRRVHITGFSQGGYMTWRMLCSQPNLFASFAPLAATAESILRSSSTPCEGADPMSIAPRPVLYTHGTADAIVLFSGATTTVDFLQVAWGLSKEEPLESGDGYKIVRYSGTGPGLLEFIEHDLRSDYSEEIFGDWQGHCFPGSTAPMGCGAGPSWGEAVLSFFEDHPKR